MQVMTLRSSPYNNLLRNHPRILLPAAAARLQKLLDELDAEDKTNQKEKSMRLLQKQVARQTRKKKLVSQNA